MYGAETMKGRLCGSAHERGARAYISFMDSAVMRLRTSQSSL